MTKKEIVKAISEEMGLTQLTTKEIVQKTFDAIIETLVEDRRIELRNFGVFEVKMRAARRARNPRTGGQVEVPAKFVVTFKPGKEMEEKVRLLEQQEAARRAGLKTAAAPKVNTGGSGAVLQGTGTQDNLKFSRRDSNAMGTHSPAPFDPAARE